LGYNSFKPLKDVAFTIAIVAERQRVIDSKQQTSPGTLWQVLVTFLSRAFSFEPERVASSCASIRAVAIAGLAHRWPASIGSVFIGAARVSRGSILHPIVRSSKSLKLFRGILVLMSE